MTDWYFDPGATGTGSADTPANAATVLNSYWFTAQSSWVHGDRLWFRRTAVATVGTAAGSFMFGRKDWNQSSTPYSWMIGWPNSGAPFYAQRPGLARSAGWDTESNTYAEYSNINMAAITDSQSAVVGHVNGLGLANFIWDMLPNAVAPTIWRTRVACSPFVPKANLHIVRADIGSLNFKGARDITLTFSNNSSPVPALTGISISKLTITASSLISGFLFSPTIGLSIQELVINTNSFASMFGTGTSIVAETTLRRIGRISGTRPQLDVASNGTANVRYLQPVSIEDWYGDGPRVIASNRNFSNRTADPTTFVNSQRVLNTLFVNSSPGIHVNNGPWYGSDHIYGIATKREFFQYTNGIEFVARIPILQVGSAQFNVESSGLPGAIQLQGAGFAELTIEPNSGFTWTGASTSIGSAWTATGRLRPSVSGSGFLDTFLGLLNPVGGEFVLVGPTFVSSS